VQLVLVSGLSGSGKSIALRVLEDAGYYCVDNLPANLLMETVDFLAEAGHAQFLDQLAEVAVITLGCGLPPRIRGLAGLHIDHLLVSRRYPRVSAGKRRVGAHDDDTDTRNGHAHPGDGTS